MGDPFATKVIGDVVVDGHWVDARHATLSFLDIGMQRGYGCFEALRSYGGRVFRLDRHISRLDASARKLFIGLPAPHILAGWVEGVAAAAGDCVVRLLITGGVDPGAPGTGSKVFVYAEPLVDLPDALRVMPLNAPWHPDGSVSELTGAKTLSYGPNLAASLKAQRAGFDDALLIGRSGSVLEGPTYGFAWVVAGVVETPALDLGILESITRGALLEVAAATGVPVETGRYPLARLLAADEVMALSTVKEVSPVSMVGDRQWAPGPVTARLSDGFSALVRAELALP